MPEGRTATCRRLLAESRLAWLRGDGVGTWRALANAEALAPADAGLRAEVLSARAVALIAAERFPQARTAAEECLRSINRLGQPTGPLRRATAFARITLASLGPYEGRGAEVSAEDLAVLDELAASSDPELSDAAGWAASNALVLRVVSIDDQLGDGPADVQAWIWVGRARAITEGRSYPGTVVRQAIDLAFRTGQWERGWDYAHSAIDPKGQRNEQVAVLAKAALLAWEAEMLAEARDLGGRALRASVAVDHPWVRVYAFLGGVVAAAAGAAPLDRALRAYIDCTSLAGHSTRPNRAWLAAQVALDAGLPTAQVREFLRAVAPAGLHYPWLVALADVVLANREGRAADSAELQTIELRRLTALDRARVLTATAGDKLRRGHHSAAVLDLQRAQHALRYWPGRVLDRVEDMIASLAPTPARSPAQGRVLDLLVEGKNNNQIADELGCSPRTVAVHVSALLRSGGSRSRTELALGELRRRMLTASDG